MAWFRQTTHIRINARQKLANPGDSNSHSHGSGNAADDGRADERQNETDHQ